METPEYKRERYYDLDWEEVSGRVRAIIVEML
jgi:hypothetical protein